MDELLENWETLKAPRLKKITRDDLMYANQKALQIINTSEELGIGIISYFDDAFPQLLKDCVNEKGKVDRLWCCITAETLKSYPCQESLS